MGEGNGGCLVLGHLKLGKMERAVGETDPRPGGQFPSNLMLLSTLGIEGISNSLVSGCQALGQVLGTQGQGRHHPCLQGPLKLVVDRQEHHINTEDY